IVLGTGGLTVNDADSTGFSTISETGGITTAANSSATLTFNIANDSDANIELTGNNNLPAAVHLDINGIAGGTTGDLGFNNSSPSAAMSQVVRSHFSIQGLSVEFDNTSISVDTLPAFSSIGNLSLTAGGNITQSSAAIVTSGDASFTVIHDGSIV